MKRSVAWDATGAVLQTCKTPVRAVWYCAVDPTGLPRFRQPGKRFSERAKRQHLRETNTNKWTR